MPKTSQQETSQTDSLYPNLNKLDLNKEQEVSASGLENTKLYVLDDGVGKIKFICIKFDEKSKHFFSKKYNFDDFIKEKGKGKIFYLAIGVKENKVNGILEEAKKLLEISISLSNNVKNDMDAYKREKISGLISHFKGTYTSNFKEYNSFQELYQSYDRKTGENISDKLNTLLKEKFSPLYGIYQQKLKKYGIQSVLPLKLILEEGEKEYTAAIDKHQHLANDTFGSLEDKFKDISNRFNDEIVQLEKRDEAEKLSERLNNLTCEAEKLKRDSVNTCHESGLYSKKVIENHNEVTQAISFLLSSLNELKHQSLTEGAINGLEKKYNELFGNLENLKKDINDSTSDKANQDTQKDISSKTQPLFNELGSLLEKVKAHKPSSGKEEIKEDFVKEIDSLLELKDSTSESLTNAINKAADFIKKNQDKAKVYTGVFSSGKSVLGGYLDQLKEILNKFLAVFSLNLSNSEEAKPSPSLR